jgi:hypothetical protein
LILFKNRKEMPRIKNEPADPSSPKGMTDEELMDERFELACVEVY